MFQASYEESRKFFAEERPSGKIFVFTVRLGWRISCHVCGIHFHCLGLLTRMGLYEDAYLALSNSRALHIGFNPSSLNLLHIQLTQASLDLDCGFVRPARETLESVLEKSKSLSNHPLRIEVFCELCRLEIVERDFQQASHRLNQGNQAIEENINLGLTAAKKKYRSYAAEHAFQKIASKSKNLERLLRGLMNFAWEQIAAEMQEHPIRCLAQEMSAILALNMGDVATADKIVDRLILEYSQQNPALASTESHPLVAKCWTIKGKIRFCNGLYKDAMKNFTKALQGKERGGLEAGHTSNAEDFEGIAHSFWSLGDYNQAIRNFRAAKVLRRNASKNAKTIETIALDISLSIAILEQGRNKNYEGTTSDDIFDEMSKVEHLKKLWFLPHADMKERVLYEHSLVEAGNRCAVLEFQKNDVLLERDSPLEFILIVVRGSIQVIGIEDELVRVVREGEFYGEFEMLLQISSHHSLHASEDGLALIVTKEAIKSILSSTPNMVEDVCKNLRMEIQLSKSMILSDLNDEEGNLSIDEIIKIVGRGLQLDAPITRSESAEKVKAHFRAASTKNVRRSMILRRGSVYVDALDDELGNEEEILVGSSDVTSLVRSLQKLTDKKTTLMSEAHFLHGLLCTRQYRYQAAAREFYSSLQTCGENSFGSCYFSISRILFEFARVMVVLGKHKEAIDALEFHSRNLQRVTQSEHVEFFLIHLAFMHVHLGVGDPIQAESYLLSAQKIGQMHYDAKHPRTSLLLSSSANLSQLQGQYKKALESYHKSIELRKAAGFDKYHALIAEDYEGIANCLAMQGKYKEADEVLEEAIEARSKKTPAGPERASALLPLLALKARHLLDQGFLDDALALANKIIDARKASEGLESELDPILSVAFYISARYLSNLCLFELARQKANQAMAICRRLYRQTHPLYIELLSFMIGLNFKFGEDDDMIQEEFDGMVQGMKQVYPTSHFLYYLVDVAVGIVERKKYNPFGALVLFQQAIQGLQLQSILENDEEHAENWKSLALKSSNANSMSESRSQLGSDDELDGDDPKVEEDVDLSEERQVSDVAVENLRKPLDRKASSSSQLFLALHDIPQGIAKNSKGGPNRPRLDPSIPGPLQDADTWNMKEGNALIDRVASARSLLPTLEESPEVWEGSGVEVFDFRFPQLLDSISNESQGLDSIFPSSLHQNIDVISMEDMVEGLGINHFLQGASLEEPWECPLESRFKELLVVEVPAFPLQIVLLLNLCAFQFALKSINHFRAVVEQAGNGNHPFLLHSELLEAICLSGLGHLSTAEALLEKCSTEVREVRVLGEQRMMEFKREVLEAMAELSELKLDYDRAAELFLQSVEPWIQMGAHAHPSVIRAGMNAARARWKAGIVKDANSHLSNVWVRRCRAMGTDTILQGIASLSQTLGSNHFEIAKFEIDLADMMTPSGVL
eukprot:768441-Hanusia_phi.AAC.10